MKPKQIFTPAFICIVFIEILADLKEYFLLIYIFKPLILISAIIYTKVTNDERSAPGRVYFLTGLWFALLGDIFLMITGQDLFVPGLASFLVMQVAYTYAFKKDISGKIRLTKAFTLLLPFLGFAVIFFVLLYQYLSGELKVAVGIYACSIAIMAWMSLLRKEFVSNQSFLLVFLGALFFMVSDSLIAIDRFVNPLPFNTIWVMSTYAAAQYMITVGYLKTK